MTEEILYRVEPDGKLHSFRILLGHGAYVNVIDRETSLTQHTVNRANFRVTSQLAWRRYADNLSLEMDYNRVFVVKALRHLSIIRGITSDYSRKDEDLENARAKAREWLLRLRDIRTSRDAALIRSTNYTS